MQKENLSNFLKDLTFEMSYSFLDNATDKEEIQEIAEKRGLELPAQDIAVFKGVYAFVDRQNLNGCTLPREEVAKALGTVSGKAVNFDHIRKNVVGYWMDAKIEGDQIIAYGSFWKGNFEDEYEMIQEMMANGELAISMEAYGLRNFHEDGTYDLTDIEFSGGALLVKTEPAFPGSKVVELSKEKRKAVLEMAKVLKAPKSYVKEKDISLRGKEISEFSPWDMDLIMRHLMEVECPGGSKGFIEVKSIDFENLQAKVMCLETDQVFMVDLQPKLKKVKDNSSSNKQKETNKMDELQKIQKEYAEYKAAKELEVKQLTEKLTEVTTANTDLKEAHKAEVEKAVADAKAEVEATIPEKIKEASEKAAKVAERKGELGEEFSKDMSDEDILDEAKFALAKAEKVIAEKDAEIADYKEGKTPKKKEDKKMEVSSEGKDKENALETAQKNVSELAFGKQD